MRESTKCPNCGREVSQGEYCPDCGARLHATGAAAATRLSSFAADPSEHVLQPTLTSAIFPHLPRHRSAPFRVALLGVAAALLLLGFLRLTGPFVAMSAAAIPALYAIYLYEVEAYDDAPIYSISVTAGVGAALGAIWALLTGGFISQTILLQGTPQGAPTWRLLVVAVLFPLVVQLLMLVGPIILRFTRSRGGVLDGFAFGAASALGFVFAATLVYLLPELRSGPVAVASGTLFALRGILRGLLVPLIDVGTTGLVGAALWLYGRPVRSLPRYGRITSLGASLIVAAMVQVALGVVDVLVPSAAVAILIYLGVAVILLFCVRFALHAMLLSEKREVGDDTRGVPGPDGGNVTCPHCGTVNPRSPFCPTCGIATRTGRHPGSARRGPTTT